MKKRSLTSRFVPALLVALILACGTVFAYMFRQTEIKTTTFTPAKVLCEVYAPLTADDKIDSVTLKNTSNIDAYLRVRLVTYWVDGDGDVAAKSSPALSVDYDEAKWVAGSGNTFYFKTPVSPEATENLTTNLLKTPVELKTEDGYKQVVDIFGEAIQADPTKAVTESWQVTLEDDGIRIKSGP